MDLPSEVPVMTLSNVILFPQAMLPLYIFEPRYRQMLRDALATHRMFSVAMRKPGRTREVPMPVAGLGLIRASVTNRDGTSNLVLQGLARVRLERTLRYKPYRVSRIQALPRPATDSVATTALKAKLLELVTERVDLGFERPPGPSSAEPPTESLTNTAMREILTHLGRVDDPEQLADLVSATLLPLPGQRQLILETPQVEDRLRHLIQFLRLEIARLRKGRPA